MRKLLYWFAKGALFVLIVFIVATTGLVDVFLRELVALRLDGMKLASSHLWELTKCTMWGCLIYTAFRFVDDLLFDILRRNEIQPNQSVE